jgi:hypothetical protein
MRPAARKARASPHSKVAVVAHLAKVAYSPPGRQTREKYHKSVQTQKKPQKDLAENRKTKNGKHITQRARQKNREKKTRRKEKILPRSTKKKRDKPGAARPETAAKSRRKKGVDRK